MIDKNGALAGLGGAARVDLELGCGSRKRNRGALGIDVIDYPDVDIVGDIYEALAAFPAASVDSVEAHHFIEHVPDLGRLMSELARVVKPSGAVDFVAPHFTNPHFYSDPTHRVFFGLYTFCYLSSGSPFARKVPTYGNKLDFTIDRVELGFKSSPPFYVRHAVKRLQGLLFNSSNFMREFWEENLCYLFPAYEVRYVLRRSAP